VEVPALGDLRDLDTLDAVFPSRGRRILNVLLLCDDRYPAGTTQSHIAALSRLSSHRVYPFNPMVNPFERLGGLAAFDAVVIHYSIFVISDVHLPPLAREEVARFNGLKVQFIQDEYRRIEEVVASIRDLGIHVLFSSLRPENVDRVYRPRIPRTTVLSSLPGYVQRDLARAEVPPLAERPLHTTYRSREVPYWLGRHARQKHELAMRFPDVAARYGLKVDVSAREAERRYGRDWIELTLTGKSVLGTEGGASIFDFTGDIERQTQAYLERHPAATFEEVHETLLAPHEGNVTHRVLTPRLFEAIALRTALVLVPGQYCGILRPWDHYVPLREDFGNAEDVARALQDAGLLQAMADRAYREIVQTGRYSERQFVARVDEVLTRAFEAIGRSYPVGVGSYRRFVLRTAIRRMRATASSRGSERWHAAKGKARRAYEAVRGGRHRKRRMLLIGVRPRATANTIVDHLRSFGRYSRHRFHFVQNQRPLHGDFGGRVRTFPEWLDLDRFDVLVIHYSNYFASELHFDARARERIRDFPGLKVLFLQDEYREVDAVVSRIREVGIDVLFTCLPEDEIEKVYPAERLPGLTRINTLTGFVPEDLVAVNMPPISDRPIDVGFRSRKVPYWLGELGREKWEIVTKFAAAAKGSGLVTDLSYEEHDRLYGADWLKFFRACKSMLGTESGASVIDFTGEIQRSVEEYVSARPEAGFDEVSERFLRPHEGRIHFNQISPRCFEAAALRTAMVLYEGKYSGVLEPWRHFIPLRKDFGNFSDVLRAIRDTAGLQRMVDRTYREIALNAKYSYRTFVERFDTVVEGELRDRRKDHRQRDVEMVFSLWFPMLLAARGLWLSAAHTVVHLGFRFYRRHVPESVRERLRPLSRKLIPPGSVG
jgi:hypothetical protein